MFKKVLITTSGLGQRLGEVTFYTNKSLVRVGKKPAISYIVESYPKEFEFVITLGWFSHHVREFLLMQYPDRTFHFVTVDPFEGQGSSLAYSILQAEEVLDEPFIFHACDTIVPYREYPFTDWMLGCRVGDSSHYISYDTQGGRVIKIYPKGEISDLLSYVGVAGIKSHREFFSALKGAIEREPNNSNLSDVIGLESLSLESIETKEWFDIGNVDGLMRARDKIADRFEILDKNDESIFIFEDSVVKFFADEGVCRDRVDRAEYLKGLIPEIESSGKNFYRYRFFQGEVLSRRCSIERFKDLLAHLEDNLWKEREGDVKEYCRIFYKDKTFSRIDKFLKDSGIEDRACRINGIEVASARDLLGRLPWDRIEDGIAVGFHGDLILDNILDDGKEFCLIDWRQNFAGLKDRGDLYYDLGKLNHNLIFNHDIIKKELFYVGGDDFKVDLLRSHRLTECQEELFRWIDRKSLDGWKVRVMSCIVWLNMAPLHHYPLNKFLYFFGRYCLQRIIDEEEQSFNRTDEQGAD